MAGKKENSAPWRKASVVIRADILEQARLLNIDISETVNRTLAERLGIDFRQQKIPEGNSPEPVIIASDKAPALTDHAPVKPEIPSAAIINADDPQAAKTIKSRNRQKEKPSREVPAPAPVTAPSPENENQPLAAPSPQKRKGKTTVPPRKKKDDAAKKFFTSMIRREDIETALIAKDDMYYAFERWCRDHRVLLVPDKKSFSVTLKNQFAVKEKMVNGTPTWVGVKVK